LLGFLFGNRDRPIVRSEKARDLRRVLDHREDLIGQLGLDQDVTGEKLPLGIDLATTTHLDHLLGGYENLFELVGEPFLAGLLLDRFGHLLLEIGIGVDDVPAGGHEIYDVSCGVGVKRRHS